MLHRRACPRCHGDMCDERDKHGDYKECLHCGHIIELVDTKPEDALTSENGLVCDVSTVHAQIAPCKKRCSVSASPDDRLRYFLCCSHTAPMDPSR